MDIAAGATDSQTPPPQVSGRPVPWTPRDVLIGLVLFIVALVGVPLALALPLALPLAYVYGSKSQPFLFVSLVVSAPAYVAVALIAVRMTFRKYGGGWARLGFARPTWATVGWGAGALFGAFALSSMYVGLVSYFDLGFLQQGCDDQVPAEIYQIPSTHPAYNVTYCAVYESTDDYVRSFAIMGAITRRNESKAFRGGELSAVFLRSDPEHHSFATFRAPESRPDHHSYETGSWNAIRDWGDLARPGLSVVTVIFPPLSRFMCLLSF